MNYLGQTELEYLSMTEPEYLGLAEGRDYVTSSSFVLVDSIVGFKQGSDIIWVGNVVYVRTSTIFGLAGTDDSSSGRPLAGEIGFSDTLCVAKDLTRSTASDLILTGSIGTLYPSTIEDPPIGFELPIVYNKRLWDSLSFLQKLTVIGGRVLDDSCFPARYVPNGYVPTSSEIQFSQILVADANTIQHEDGSFGLFDYVDVLVIRTLETSSNISFSDELISARNYDFALVDEIVFDHFGARFQGYDASASSDITFAGIVEGGRIRDVITSNGVAFLGAASGTVGAAGDDWSHTDDWSELADWSTLE